MGVKTLAGVRTRGHVDRLVVALSARRLLGEQIPHRHWARRRFDLGARSRHRQPSTSSRLRRRRTAGSPSAGGPNPAQPACSSTPCDASTPLHASTPTPFDALRTLDALPRLDAHALRRLAHATGLPQPPTRAILLRRRAVNSPSAGGISPAQVASSSTPRSRGRISTSAATDVRKTPSSSRRGLVVCWGNKSRAAGGLVHASMFEFFASARCLGLSTSRR